MPESTIPQAALAHQIFVDFPPCWRKWPREREREWLAWEKAWRASLCNLFCDLGVRLFLLAFNESDCFAQLSSLMLYHLKCSTAAISHALSGQEQLGLPWHASSLAALAKSGGLCLSRWRRVLANALLRIVPIWML